MSTDTSRGLVYRCPVCGAELSVLAHHTAAFKPRCCNVAMVMTACKLCFYICPVCGAEIAVIREGSGDFAPHCCNVDMVHRGAA